jgi:hypothetical protein
VCVVVWMNNERGTTMKENDADSGALMAWCFGYERCKMETRLSGEIVTKIEMTFL